MNSQQKTLLITSILAITLLSGSISVGNVYATGNLDDEEEEEAIEELQSNVAEIEDNVNEIKDDVDGLTLNLEEGLNNIDLSAICPSVTPEEQEPEQNETEVLPECNPIPEPVEEPEPTNQTIIPDINVTEPIEECNPIPEPEQPEQNNRTVLEPIICPINGELLGYTNTTSGELLPPSAGNETEQVEEEQPQIGNNNTNGGFLPPIEIPEAEANEEPAQEVGAPEVEQEAPQCNVTATPEEEPLVEQPAPQEPALPPSSGIEFDDGCGCYVTDTDGDEAATDF